VEVNKPTELILSRLKPYWHKHDAIAWDVSTRSTGYAIWRKGLFYGGSFQPDGKMSTYERIAFMADEARKLMKELFKDGQVDVFLESGIARSITNAMLLGEARGAIIGACSTARSFNEISNSTWKSILGARARDSDTQKREAYETLCKWLGFEIDQTYCEHYKKFTFDESDAYGVLITAITTKNYEEEE